MTLETLATIKNSTVVIARQANINNGGQQQVNNAMPPCSRPSPTRAKSKPGKPNYWRQAMTKGWTPERRAKQAALIQTWKPWERSTGPRTDKCKAASSRNGFKSGQWRNCGS